MKQILAPAEVTTTEVMTVLVPTEVTTTEVMLPTEVTTTATKAANGSTERLRWG